MESLWAVRQAGFHRAAKIERSKIANPRIDYDSLFERDDQIRWRGFRCVVALADDHKRVGAYVLGQRRRDSRLKFAGTDESCFQQFPVQCDAVKLIKAAP